MYETHFGLLEPPFRLTPDPRFLFLSAHHREAIAHLRYGLDDGAGFVAITGEIGAGKTTLVRSVLRESESDLDYAYILDPSLRGVEILSEINQELGLKADGDRRSLLGALQSYLLEQRSVGRRVIVVVDEAQALDVETLEQLRVLSNFETETAKLLQIVLVGQPELRELLARPELEQLGQRVAVRFHLGPLDRRETAAYIEHRISVASGGTAAGLFSRAALARIHREARGLPRLINVLCHRALLAAYAQGHRRIGWRTAGRAAHEVAGTLAAGQGGLVARRRSKFALAAGLVGILATAGVIAGGRNFLGWSGSFIQKLTRDASQRTGDSPGSALLAEARSAAGEAVPVSGASGAASLVLGNVASGDQRVESARPDNVVEEPAALVEELSWADPFAQERLALVEVGRQWSSAGSAYEAVEALLRVLELEPLSAAEAASPAMDLEAIATSRAVEYSAFDGALEPLSQLGAPAILELDLGLPMGVRYALLRRVEGKDVHLVVGRTPLTVSREVLSEAWVGLAHLVWDDRWELGPLLEQGTTGPRVQRLHRLLAEAGFWSEPEGGSFDQSTADAVLAFQRSRGLVEDGMVGPFTLLALYRTGLDEVGPALVEPTTRVGNSVRDGGAG